jgi:N-carbamoyl-L-amino-acid hydrolase
MITINAPRFLEDLSHLAQFGRIPAVEGGGLDRRPFSAAEREARRFISGRAEAAGLETWTDAAANLSVRLPSPVPGARSLLLGSHLDTVPNGGAYDGALGVVAALELLRVLKEREQNLPCHLEAIAFTDEEGRFGDFFGSKAVAGLHTPQTVAAFLARAAEFSDDLDQMRQCVPGRLAEQSIHLAARSPDSLVGFLELHVEQGPLLEHHGVSIGVVKAVFGRRTFRIVFHGRADHAGTTPIYYRADALVAAAQFVVEVRNYVGHLHPEAVITCGDLRAQPGVFNVVPEEAVLLVEFRAADEATLDDIEKMLKEVAGRCARPGGLSVSLEPVHQQSPVALHAGLQAAIRQAATALQLGWMELPSGAGHDAQIMASITSAGLIFVPSAGGRSHTPDEFTAPDDLVAGADTLLQTVLILAKNDYC